MKLYEMTRAPNPRRVRIFLAEKGIEVPLVQVDMSKGEHKAPQFLAKNPSGKIPVLELDDGTCIAESVAICRYFEAVQPAPSLFGATPVAIGRIDMANRQLEFELFNQVGTSWVNGPIVAQMAPGRFKQNAQAKAASDAAVPRFYERLDRVLANQQWMAGDDYSVADITGLCCIDFATNLVDLKPAAEFSNLWRWHADATARPSAKA